VAKILFELQSIVAVIFLPISLVMKRGRKKLARNLPLFPYQRGFKKRPFLDIFQYGEKPVVRYPEI
jgi:hypothetical protein